MDEAINAIRSGAIEARSAMNGVGLVRLMGRQSGFIAMHASLASGEVDVCLIPEIDTPLDGPGGVIAHVRRVLTKSKHCVIVVAEGAGQEILGKMGETDASGNPVLQNFGQVFEGEMLRELEDLKPDIKYIDPTYMVRARPTNSSDAIYCSILGQNAVHAAFAGLTGVTGGLCNGHYVYLPIPPLISKARRWTRRDACGRGSGSPSTSPCTNSCRKKTPRARWRGMRATREERGGANEARSLSRELVVKWIKIQNK